MAALLLRLLVVLQRGWFQYQGHLLLVGGNLVAASWVLFGRRYVGPTGRPTIELALCVAAALFTTGLPWLLGILMRRAFADERLMRAARLASWRAMLVPGYASQAESELYEQMALARGGRADEVVASLRRRLAEAEPPEDEAIQERIATLYVFARRYREAIVHFETHLAKDPSRYPGLAIQMVQAYGEVGELSRAAELVMRLEETLSPHDPTGQAVLLQIRLHLLAAAGAVRAIERLLALDGLRRMPRAMREGFIATARAHAAQQDVHKADQPVHTADPSVPTPDPAAPPAADEELARFLEGVAERAALDVRAAVMPARPTPPVTIGLVAACFLAYALLQWFFWSAAPPEPLVRAGANLHPAVRAGEWYRLWTAAFIHAEGLHLFFNAYGLYLLGRLVEPALGRARFFVVFGVSVLAGNLLSVFNPRPEAVLSLGASGGVLGVMGALMVTLVLRRASYPERVRRGLLVNVGLLLLVLVGVGFTMHYVDNFAHVGGLLAGGAAAFLLAPGGWLGEGRAARALVGALVFALCASLAASVVTLVRTDLATTIGRLPLQRLRLSSVSVALPAGSRILAPEDEHDGSPELYAEATGLHVQPSLEPAPQGQEGVLAAAVRADAEDIRKKLETANPSLHIEPAPAPPMAGWSEAAQRVAENVLLLYYARPLAPDRPTQVVLVRLYRAGGPRLSPVLEREVRRVLDSVEVAPEVLASPAPVFAPPAARTVAVPGDGGAPPPDAR